MNLVTISMLTQAIMNRLGYMQERAREIALLLLDMFGYNDRIIDNVLLPEDRQLFYLLQSAGIISNGREETILYDGREWRTHYWEINRENIIDYAKDSSVLFGDKKISDTCVDEDLDSSIYSRLTDDVWNTRKIFHNKPSLIL